MRNDVVVFSGPTLSAAEGRNHLDAIFLPPVGSGDVVRAVAKYAPSAIALIDGVFGQAPAIRHKEIMWAMSRGVRMYGASSIGALRAAELAPQGMVGHGLIYRYYRRNPLADDADVTVPMAPPELGSQALGEALIDIRLTLKSAERNGIISEQLRRLLEASARSIHFRDRSFSKILAAATRKDTKYSKLGSLSTWLRSGVVKQKKSDAESLLQLISLGTHRSQPEIQSNFQITEAFALDMDYYNLFDHILPCAS
ncbi:TfuA-like protein [Rhizobium leguminosarum]|uniref:TfuA-like protein n=1 Tax=Rhizobium leguminosarum TaxID=384 RepID=UPI003F9DBFAD